MSTTPGVVDWLAQFTQDLTNLTMQNGSALSNFGMVLLAFIATMKLIGIAVRLSPWSASIGSHRSVNFDEIKVFLFRFLFCLVVEYYWVNNLPGASFGFNRMFSYIGAQIAQILDQNELNNLTQLFSTAGANTPMPALFAPLEVIAYTFATVTLGISSGVLFLINASSFIIYAVTALFGPLLIPLYLTETFRGKFIHFVEVLASFAMIRAVAAAFIFVWAQFLTGFITTTFQGNYSIANWLANLIPYCTIILAFNLNMVLVPSITQAIFGGGAGIAGKIGEMVEKAALRAGI
jgi:hypothetical protein